MFENPLSESYLWFVQSHMSVINRQILKLEKADSSVLDVSRVLEETLMLVQQRKEERFVPLKSKSILKKAEDEAGLSAAEINKFYGEVAEFYNTCHAYLQKWMLPLNEFSIFNWMLLVSVPQWNLVEQTVEFLHAKGQSIDESLLFDQFSCLKACIEAVLVNEKDDWNKKSSQEKWTYFFKQCECVE